MSRGYPVLAALASALCALVASACASEQFDAAPQEAGGGAGMSGSSGSAGSAGSTPSGGSAGTPACEVQRTELLARADTWLQADHPDMPTQYVSHFCVSRSYPWRALVRFDLAGGIPTRATLVSATLSLTLSQQVQGTALVDIHRVRAGRPWVEESASWLEFSAGSPWSSPGGDFEAMPSASTLIEHNVEYGEGSTPFEWDLLVDARAFHADDSVNFGWLLKDASEPSSGSEPYYTCFASRQPSSFEIASPTLSVEYCID